MLNLGDSVRNVKRRDSCPAAPQKPPASAFPSKRWKSCFVVVRFPFQCFLSSPIFRVLSEPFSKISHISCETTEDASNQSAKILIMHHQIEESVDEKICFLEPPVALVHYRRIHCQPIWFSCRKKSTVFLKKSIYRRVFLRRIIDHPNSTLVNLPSEELHTNVAPILWRKKQERVARQENPICGIDWLNLSPRISSNE